MYQFRREDTALEAARLLAVYEREPIFVMAGGTMRLFTIGPRNNAAVHEAGRHMATVYRSGQVDYKGLRIRFLLLQVDKHMMAGRTRDTLLSTVLSPSPGSVLK